MLAGVLVAAAPGGIGSAHAKRYDKQRGGQKENASKQRQSAGDPVSPPPAASQPKPSTPSPVVPTQETSPKRAKQRTTRSRDNTGEVAGLRDDCPSQGSTSQPTRSQPSSPSTGTPSTAAPSAAAAPNPGAASNINVSGSQQTSGASRRRSAARRRASGERAAARVLGAGAGLSLGSTLLGAATGSDAGGEATPSGSGGGDEGDGSSKSKDESNSAVGRTVSDIVEVVPRPSRCCWWRWQYSRRAGGGYLFLAERGRRLARQRSDLLQEVGLLQTALLPPVPATVGAVRTSVAYRPSDGPGAGGDFYDALTLPGGRAAFILGDVSGHGRQALARTAFMRYTLSAYLEAGLEPRIALQVAGSVIDEHLAGDFATVVLAVHDPSSGSLTYACAGHPAPIVVGATQPEPVLAASSPPIGLGMRTGLRQTTLPLPAGSVVCLYTDGLAEARTEKSILGRPRLGDIVGELGRDATAAQLLDRVSREARLVTDDMATVMITPTAGVTAGGFRSEQIEIDPAEAEDGIAESFLEACGVETEQALRCAAEVAALCKSHGGAVMHVRFGMRGPQVEVLPRNVESFELAQRRAATA